MKSKFFAVVICFVFLGNIASFALENTQPPSGQVQPYQVNNGLPPNQPMDPNFKPMDPNQRPMDPNFKPMDPNQRPMDPNFKPMDPNQRPMDPNFKPMDPNQRPMDPNFKPMDPNQRPMDPNFKPMDPNQRPMDPNFKPMDPNQRPMDPNFKPMDPNQRPMDPNFKPMDPNQRPIIPNGMNKEGWSDPKNPKFNPFDAEYKRENQKSVFKDVYGQFFKEREPMNNANLGQNGKPGQTPQGTDNKSVYNSIYKFENNISNLNGQREGGELPKFENEKARIGDMLEKFKQFQGDRDKQYAKMLQVLTVIEQLQDENMKKQLIFEFQGILENQTRIDMHGNSRIESAFKFINNFFPTLTPEEKEKVKEELKLVIENHQKQKEVIKLIHDKFKALKSAVVKDSLQLLMEKAQELSKNGQKEDAAKIYEQALFMDQNNSDLIKEAGKTLNETEGNGPKVFVKGQRPEFDVKPTIVNGRTLVPLRAIANSLGITNENIKYDGATQTITLIKGDNEVKLTIGKAFITINNVEKPIDVPAMVIDGRTLVPARVVSEALDAKVNYEPTSKIVTIEDKFGTDTTSSADTEIKALSIEVNANIQGDSLTEKEVVSDYLEQ